VITGSSDTRVGYNNWQSTGQARGLFVVIVVVSLL
jgi:hypothetical protein